MQFSFVYQVGTLGKQDSSVGIETGYGLYGWGSIQDTFIHSTASRPALGPTQPPIQ
jgi:hypothetical protein